MPRAKKKGGGVYKRRSKIEISRYSQTPSTLLLKNLKISFVSTVHSNPSRKRSFPKTLFKPVEFENAVFVFLWTEHILRTKLFENDDVR